MLRLRRLLSRIPTYFLIALAIHVILGGLTFTVYLGGDIIASVQKRVSQIMVFTHVSRAALVRSRQADSAAPPTMGASDQAPVPTPETPGVERTSLDALPPLDLPRTAMLPIEQPADAPPAMNALDAPAIATDSLPLAPFSPPPAIKRDFMEESVPLETVTPRPQAETEIAAATVVVPKAENQLPPPATPALPGRTAPNQLVPQTPAADVASDTPVAKSSATASDLTLSLKPRTKDAAEDVIPLDAPAAANTSPRSTASEIAQLDVPLPRSAPAGMKGGDPLVTRAAQAKPNTAPVNSDLAPPLVAAKTTDSKQEFGPKAARRQVAEDTIGLTALLQLRQGPAKQDAVEAFGGNAETQAAVRRGLDWLARHQHADGYWTLNEFHKTCQGHQCQGHGSVKSDPAATGFALMCFLGDGHSPQQGDYQAHVKRGILWLLSQQHKDGDLAHGVGNNAHMYSHAIATIALCEAYALTKDQELAEPAKSAVAFIVAAQHKPSGGWRYVPNQDADTSVVGWQIMALKSAQVAGLSVPDETMQLTLKWLSRVEREGNERGRFGYQTRDNSPAMTAEALLCLEYIGVKRDDPSLVGGVNFLLERLPKQNEESSYYWYYGTQAMYHVGGEPWQKWNGALRDILLTTQVKDGHHAGTWDVRDPWEQHGGRLYATALRILMLETYYRHLPLY